MVKAAIGDYLAVEETWPGVEVERALWFVFAVARSRGAKARRRQIRGRPPFVADRYFQSVRFDEAFFFFSGVAGMEGGGGGAKRRSAENDRRRFAADRFYPVGSF